MLTFAQLLFERWIVRFLGIRTRWLFFRLFGQKVTLSDLEGKKDELDSQWVQDFCNAVVGMMALVAVFFLLAYAYDWTFSED